MLPIIALHPSRPAQMARNAAPDSSSLLLPDSATPARPRPPRPVSAALPHEQRAAGFQYASVGASHSSVDLHPKRRDSAESSHEKKPSNAASFMGGIFHRSRKKSSRDESISPAKSTSSLKIPAVYSNQNFSDTRLGSGVIVPIPPHAAPTQHATVPHATASHATQAPPPIPPKPAPTAEQPSPPPPPPPPAVSSPQALVLCTLDHEHFTLVNVAGLSSAEALKRVFAERLHLAAPGVFHRTELGEQERADALSDDELLDACKRADPHATLKLFVRPTQQHFQSAPDVLMQPAMRRQLRRPSATGLLQPNQRADDTNFKLIPRPTPSIDFDQRRQSPYGQSTKFEHDQHEFTALRNPPPPPPGRQGSLSGRRPSLQTPLISPMTTAEQTWKHVPEKTFNVPRKSLTPSVSSLDIRHAEPPPPPPPPPPPKDAEPHKSNQAFQENDVSFDDAPGFPEFDDADDSADDDGLWAKKPPQTTAMPVMLAAPDSVTGKASRPVLHVKIGGTEIIGIESAADLTESTATVSASTSSPASVVSELPSAERFRRQDPLQRRPIAPDDVWAVRPPAELVYENLEKFFPDADLDKPIIDDTTPLYSPNSPQLERKSVTLEDPPSSSHGTPRASDPAHADPPMNQDPDTTLADDTSLNRGFSFRSTSHDGLPAQEKIDVPPKPQSAAPPPEEQPAPRKAPRSMARGARMKSIRVVAREASEARRNLAKDEQKPQGALLRRKSTKMWGQRVVEVTKGQITKGQLSVAAESKQFNWVKGELIGKGTFGRVYLALNATTGEMIAVKQVDVPSTASDKDSEKQREVVDALNAEIETMKDLDHLNIVQYLGYEALPDVCSLFLEYVPGGSIGTCLRKHGRFERPVIHSLTRQVVDGLAYLHSKGILHRDLKSDNLLLDLDGVCKISDFGISKRSQDIYSNDAEMSMQGTIFWMAPEVIHNVVHNERQGYSAKVDIWSLGCVVLEMFAGRRPWSNDEAIGAMYKLGNAKLAPPIPDDTVAYVCEDGKEFLNSCFTIDPESRPTAQLLLDSSFCAVDPAFNFAETNLAKLIKFNDKRKP